VADAGAEQLDELTISFREGDTPDPHCVEYSELLYTKVTAPDRKEPWHGAYVNGASILVLPSTYDEYWMGAAGYGTRRKVRRALKGGYAFAEIDRDQHLDEIFEINTSAGERQGRPMTEAYRVKPEPFGPLPAYGCPRHAIRTYGVLLDGRLVAYTWVYVVGDMCLFSTILGHADHLAEGVMYLLVAESLRRVIAESGTRYAMYNMHRSGTEGLRFFKEQMGFRPFWVNWQRRDEPVARPVPPIGPRRVEPAARPAPSGLRRVARRIPFLRETVRAARRIAGRRGGSG
jgi:Acetyltransferase (GNAT) domain